jgi:hypothetical protein
VFALGDVGGKFLVTQSSLKDLTRKKRGENLQCLRAHVIFRSFDHNANPPIHHERLMDLWQ